ncbi:MAG: polymer-forming cytoskeletal protein [Bacilli bacterium]|nr:polymer-forming cytoskeletal protein [Bacilli bacterium]
MKKKLLFLLLIISILVIPVSAKEKDGILSNHKEGNRILSSAFTAEDNVNLEKEIDGLSFVAGNTVNVSNKQDYLFVAGNTINVKNATSKDTFVAGNSITIDSKNLLRDLFIAGNSITVKSPVKRDLYIAGESITVDNNVDGDLKAGGTAITINGEIKGDAYVDAEKITITDKAKIGGTLKYPDNAKVEISKEASIEKTTKFKGEEIDEDETFINKVLSTFVAYLNLLVIGLIALAIFKIEIKKEKFDLNYVVTTSAKGLMVLFLVPIFALLFLIVTTGTGARIAFFLVTLYALAIYISAIPVAIYISKLLPKIDNKYLKFALSLFIIYVVRYIPFLGSIATFIVLVFGLGILLNLLHKNKSKKEAK